MAEQSVQSSDDKGAPMDYAEHEKTYALFLMLVKWGIITNVALLIAMAAGFFGGAGFIGGVLLFVVLMIAAKIIV